MAKAWSCNIDLKQFQNDLRRLPLELRDEVEKTNSRYADKFEETIRRNVSRSETPPHIGDTITHTKGDPATFEHIVTIGNDSLPYVGPLEWGHSLLGHPVEGAHFWHPAKILIARQHRRALVRAIRKGLRRLFP